MLETTEINTKTSFQLPIGYDLQNHRCLVTKLACHWLKPVECGSQSVANYLITQPATNFKVIKFHLYENNVCIHNNHTYGETCSQTKTMN